MWNDLSQHDTIVTCVPHLCYGGITRAFCALARTRQISENTWFSYMHDPDTWRSRLPSIFSGVIVELFTEERSNASVYCSSNVYSTMYLYCSLMVAVVVGQSD